MSLEYLNGIMSGPKKVARQEKRAVKKEARAEKKQTKAPLKIVKKAVVKLSPVTKSKLNKLQVQSKIRKTFAKKSEPIKVEEEEIVKDQEEPADVQAEETTPEETQQADEQQEQLENNQTEEDQADMGIFYPNFGKPKKGKLKNKIKAKVKSAVKKAKDRKANDKHTPKQKLAHKLAKVSMVLPRGAFLSILLLGKALEKTPVKLNLAKAIVKDWAKNGKQFKELWYKFGGEPDILVKQINQGAKASISGDLGVATATAVTGTVATASPILVGIMKILKKGGDFVKNNPQLVAKGQEIAKSALLSASKKEGGNLEAVNDIADTITKVMPPDTQRQINSIRKLIPKGAKDKLVKNATTDVKTVATDTGNITNLEPGTTPGTTPTKGKNKMLLIGGGALVLGLGAYMLMKRGKN
jgi:hypothetical protein